MKKIIETVAEGGGELGVHMYPFLPRSLAWLLLPKAFEVRSMCGFAIKEKKPRQCEVGPFRQSNRAQNLRKERNV